MLEARFMVPSNEVMEDTIKPALIAVGAARKGWYGLTDILYGPEPDYNERFVRLRIARNANTPLLSVVLTHKATTWGLYSKTDTILLHKPFEDMASADAYIQRTYSGVYQKQFCFSRDGMRYVLGDIRIFAEDIFVPGIRWSVEIEGPDDPAIIACAALLGLGEPIHDSVPALVQRRLQETRR